MKSIWAPLLVTAFLLLIAPAALAQIAQHSTHMVPTGKGWGVEVENAPAEVTPDSVTTGNGISYHGGPIMAGNPVHVYFIWYGGWTSSSGANSTDTVGKLRALLSSTGLDNSAYEKINTTYGSSSANVSGALLRPSGTDWFAGYPYGKTLSDAEVFDLAKSYVSKMQAGKPDNNGVYVVMSSSDVGESSGFCNKYCGWHSNNWYNGINVKYGFVGNSARCPSSCEGETSSPNGNAAANGMASIIAHETEEAISDPYGNAWYDTKGNENADKCAWKFGPTKTASNGSHYNQVLGGYEWLIQMNWENSRGGGCDQVKGGKFYTF